MRRTLLCLMIISALLNKAFSNCGSASCPLAVHTPMSTGRLHSTVMFEYIDQNSIYVGSQPSFVGAIPQDHDEVRTINRLLILRFEYGITQTVGVSVQIPFVSRNHAHILNAEHDPVLLRSGSAEGIQHHNGAGPETWSFSGLGDAEITGYFSLLDQHDVNGIYLAVSAGVKMPTGVTDLVNTNGSKAEVTIQPGSGSFDGIFGADMMLPIASVPGVDWQYSTLPFRLSVAFRATGKGTDDYRFGNRWVLNAGAEYRISDMFTLLFQVNGRIEEFADVGFTGEPGENTGGMWWFVSPGLTLNMVDFIAVETYVQVPFYQNVPVLSYIILNVRGTIDMRCILDRFVCSWESGPLTLVDAVLNPAATVARRHRDAVGSYTDH